MKVMIKDKNTHQVRINRIIDWLIYMLGYSVILLAVCLIFKKTISIDSHYFGIWVFITSVLVYILNKTIKPILVWLTIPLTGMTLGLFYPFINVFILNIVDFILVSHFDIQGLLMSFIVAILISLMNAIMDTIIIEPLIRRYKS